MKVANCPGCGAQIEFKIGSSLVLICPYCRAAVARTDRDVESLGKVSALIDTGSVLSVGLAGRYAGTGYRLVGRAQLRHDSGSVWDEWYAAFDDGRWGWVEDADGYYFVTFETAASEVPNVQRLAVGDRIDDMSVFEAGRAEVVSAEGEMPWRAVPGTTYRYVDLSGPDKRFATVEARGAATLVFKGREVSLADLGVPIDATPHATRVGVQKISCTKCGAPLNLLAPGKTERIVCPSCRALHAVRPGSILEFLTAQKQKIEPLIPIGREGTIDGVKYVVAGFMTRTERSGVDPFSWDEYLLFNRSTGFRYLTHDELHWSIEQPILPGGIVDTEPMGSPPSLEYDGRHFKLFERSAPEVTFVLGEFPWKVSLGETVKTSDYIAPPEGMSKELFSTKQGDEINYSIARYFPVEDVEEAFGVGGLPRPAGVGSMEPNPSPSLSREWALAMTALLIIALIVAITLPRRLAYKDSIDLGTVAISDVPGIKKFSTRSFPLSGHRNLLIRGYSNVANGDHVELAGEFDHAESDVSEMFDLWMEYSSGSDDEGPWTEDERTEVVSLPALPEGHYTIHFDAKYNGATPPIVDLEIREGIFRWSHLILAVFGISIIPLITGLRRHGFEVRRWSDSDYSPYAKAGGDDDDDDDDDDD